VYDDCPYLCLTKKQHHSRYARIRKSNKSVETKKIPSPKVNWYVVEQLKIGDKPIRKKRIDNNDEIELQ
jgi:hypothetical protein